VLIGLDFPVAQIVQGEGVIVRFAGRKGQLRVPSLVEYLHLRADRAQAFEGRVQSHAHNQTVPAVTLGALGKSVRADLLEHVRVVPVAGTAPVVEFCDETPLDSTSRNGLRWFELPNTVAEMGDEC